MRARGSDGYAAVGRVDDRPERDLIAGRQRDESRGSGQFHEHTPGNRRKGATVTNLYADSNATVTGTDTVLVAVIDNTTGATLLSCTVNKTNKNSCFNSSGSGSAAAGGNIEVKLSA